VCQWRAGGKGCDRFLRTFTGHGNGVRGALAVGPKLWTCSDDATLRVWDLATAECERVIDHRRHVGLDPSSSTTSSSGRAVGGAPSSSGAALCLATDGDAVWSGADDGTVRLWHLTTHACLAATTSQQAQAGLEVVAAAAAGFKGSGAGGSASSKVAGKGSSGGKDNNDGQTSVESDSSSSSSDSRSSSSKLGAAGAKLGAGQRITCLAQMGAVMWSAGQDASVGVWDRNGPRPRLVRRLPGHTSFVNSLCRVK
jgi:WD40 repeat protein